MFFARFFIFFSAVFFYAENQRGFPNSVVSWIQDLFLSNRLQNRVQNPALNLAAVCEADSLQFMGKITKILRHSLHPNN
jgi:hypothetical protein